MATMLYHRRADHACAYYCCCDIGTSGGKRNRLARQTLKQMLRTREERAWRDDLNNY